MLLTTSKKIRQGAPSRSLSPVVRGWCGVEGDCLLVVLIGRLGRRRTGLVGVLNGVPAAAKHGRARVWPTRDTVRVPGPLGLFKEDGKFVNRQTTFFSKKDIALLSFRAE